MDERLNKIESKIDKLDERLDSIDKTLVKQSCVLEDHTRRSLANEKAVEILKDELKVVFNHVTIVNFLGKLCLLAVTSGLLWKLLSWSFSK